VSLVNHESCLLPIWNARIAPVFDTASQVHIVEAESGRIVGAADEAQPGDLPAQQVMRLAELGVGTLGAGRCQSRDLL
jgi:hypothetical protein